MDKKYKLLAIMDNYHSNWVVVSGISNFQTGRPRTLRLVMDHHEQADRIIQQWKPDVLIVHGDYFNQIDTTLPVVTVFGERTGLPSPFNVTMDNAAIGKIGAEYFLEKGFRHFAFITGDRTMPFSAPRLKEFHQSLAGQESPPLVYDDLFLSGLNPIHSSDKNMRKLECWLKKAPKPLAAFAHDDTHGLHVLEACERAELQVPDEVAILGVDNHPILCTYSTPQLSSIELPFSAIGDTAARIAEEILLEKDKAPENIALPPLRIVTRGSSDTIASKRPELQRAIQFISTHIDEPLQPKDVVERTFVSRSKLQRIFRNELNRTILEEIHRQKLARAKDLLEQTSLTVYEIGERCGMPESSQFIRLFRQKTGISPLKYREACRSNRTYSY